MYVSLPAPPTIVSAPGLLAPGTLVTFEPSGFLSGAQAGVNWQFGTWVLGAEFDWSWTNASDTVLTPSLIPGVSGRADKDVNWFATATGRLGYAWNNVLIYAKGGAAWAEVDYAVSVVATPGGTVLLGPAFISAPESASPQSSITPGKAWPITFSA